MTTDTQYWAVLWDGDDVSQPRTIVRRRSSVQPPADEILRRDGSWHHTNVLGLAELNLYEHELRPISATDALEFERTFAEWRRAREQGDG